MLKAFISTLMGLMIGWMSPLSLAQEGATVLGVVSPAWISQPNGRQALRPGYQIQPEDRIETETGGRVQLAFSNNVEFQLGEKAQFKAHRLQLPGLASEPYKGFVEVLVGAFRYIGEAFGPGPKNSDFRVKVGYSTIGLRGTDFWGVTDRTTDTIVLIEGAITVTPDQGAPFTMDTPQTIVQNVLGSSAGTVRPVAPELLQESAAQTALPTGRGVMTQAGQHQVVLASFSSVQSALNYAAQVDAQGYPAEIESNTGQSRNRVLLNGFVSRADALYFVQNKTGSIGVQGAWIKQKGQF